MTVLPLDEPLPLRGYQVALADPAWEFKTYSADGGNRGVQRHYDVMNFDDICGLGHKLGLRQAMARNSVMHLWTTFPMLERSFRVLADWGFKYSTGLSWAKRRKDGSLAIGTGYFNRGCSEICLIGTRGNVGLPTYLREPGHIDSLRRENSRKPAELYDRIERQFPVGPYLELFGRHERPGWDVCGNQSGKFLTP